MSVISKKTTNITYLVLYLAFLIPVLLMNCSLCSTEVLDETSNLSIAAFVSGYDWSYTNLALGQYFYKYFQVLFYVPFLKMNIDPQLRYRLMMAFNSLVFCFIPLICFYILRNVLNVDHKKSILCSVAVGSISSVLFYTQHVNSDLFIEVFPWITVLLMIKSMKAIENNDKKKPCIFSVLIAFISVCSYASHTRGIILVISVVLSVLLMTVIWKKKIVNPFFFYPTLVVCLIADRLLNQYFKANAFPFGVAHGSLESIDKEALISIFTSFSGFTAFIKLIVGWAFTAAASTFGLCVCALLAACVILLNFHKNKEKSDKNELLIIYMGVLNFLGSAAMGVIYFFPHVKPIFLGIDYDHANRIIYERYMAYSFGFLCLIVFILLIRHKEWFTVKLRVLSILVHSVIVFLFVAFVAPCIDYSTMPLRHSVSLLRFFELPYYGATYGVYPDASSALFKMGVYSVVALCLMMIIYSLGKKSVFLILLFTVFNIDNTINGFFNIRYAADIVRLNTTRPVYDAMKPFLNMDEKYKKVCCCSTADIKEIQFDLPDFVCYGYYQKTYLPEENVIYIINSGYDQYVLDSLLEGKDSYLVSDIACEDNYIFITGDEFAGVLRNEGHTLVRYSEL